MSTPEAVAPSYTRGITVHNRVINKIGTVFEVSGDELVVMTASGLLKWSVKDVDQYPDDPN